MANIDQIRADSAFKNVTLVPSSDRKSYDTQVHSLPALLRSAGLSQALHFLASRKNNPGAALLLGHLEGQLKRLEPAKISSKETLLSFVRGASTIEYLALTRESLAVAAWHRRAVQALDPKSALNESGGPPV